MAFLSNHAHFMLQGPPNQVPPFIGFIKREISRRWGRHASVGWRGTMWHEYRATALPTSESQVRCLKYILSQGVKEGLVARPEEWPGVHCARALLHDEPLHGTWLNATTYSRAIDSQSRRRSPRVVPRREHLIAVRRGQNGIRRFSTTVPLHTTDVDALVPLAALRPDAPVLATRPGLANCPDKEFLPATGAEEGVVRCRQLDDTGMRRQERKKPASHEPQ
jgi:hypothetical protein